MPSSAGSSADVVDPVRAHAAAVVDLDEDVSGGAGRHGRGDLGGGGGEDRRRSTTDGDLLGSGEAASGDGDRRPSTSPSGGDAVDDRRSERGPRIQRLPLAAVADRGTDTEPDEPGGVGVPAGGPGCGDHGGDVDGEGGVGDRHSHVVPA
ncbi:hypothetical protein ABE10_10540, partial [Bacillus toyonensis]|nr:hypothetical protein [Bacillus toyonensis]